MTQTHNTSYLGSLSLPEDHPDAKTMIKVDHVTMIFNIASEQLNSLKEYAIALSRKELRFKEFRALDNVSFEVKQGDVFGILGTNGSGKSTVLKIIAGVLEPSEGTCTVKGSIAPLIELGAGFDLELTARENIFLNGALLGYSKKFIQEHFDEIVEFAEVRDFLDMPMKNYSSGMVARIAFAIATVIIPDVLIVDEVLSVGDFMFQQKCEQRIQSLIKDYGVTVLIVSHNNAQIERLCNKAVWIEKGHLRAIGSAKDVCAVYRAVGGRSGSPESESVVLDALSHCKTKETPRSVSIAGENRYGTAVKMASFCAEAYETILITNSDSGESNLVANSIAGFAGGALLTSAADHLPDATMQELRHEKPRRIIIIGDEKQISKDVELSISSLCPDSDLVRIGDNEKCFSINAFKSAQMLLSKQWSNTAAIATSPDDPSLISFTPYLYEESIPLFFLKVDNELEIVETLLSDFSYCLSFTDANALSTEARQKLDAIELIYMRSDGSSKPHSMYTKFAEACGALNLDRHTCIITSPHSNIDNYCIGPLAGKIHARILFCDPLSLDSVASTLQNLHSEKSIDQLIFIGNELRFSKIDKVMFESALNQ